MTKITADTKVTELPFVGGAKENGIHKDVGPLIAEFKTQYRMGIEAWARAGLLVKEIFDADPDAMPRLVKETNLPPSVINKFLSVGRGWLLPQLLAAPKKVRALPVADQRRAASGTLPLVVKNGNAADIRRVDLALADSGTCAQLIGPDGIRSVEEQTAWLASKERREAAARAAEASEPNARWKFGGGRVHVTHPGVVTPWMVRQMAAKYGIRVRKGG